MKIFRTSDRAEFLAKRPPGKSIRVVRMPIVPLVRHSDGRRGRVPAVELTYSFINGEEERVFSEVRFADDNGFVDLQDTLWAQLHREGGYRLLHCSGSF